MSQTEPHENLSEQQLEDAYQQFKSIPADKWHELDPDQIREILEERGKGGFEERLDDEGLTDSLEILGKVAREYDRDKFIEAVRERTLPPVQLSDEKMELVRGGFPWVPVAIGIKTAADIWQSGKAFVEGFKEGYNEADAKDKKEKEDKE